MGEPHSKQPGKVTWQWSQPVYILACVELKSRRPGKALTGTTFESAHYDWINRKKVLGAIHVFFPQRHTLPPLDTPIELEGVVKCRADPTKPSSPPYMMLIVDGWKFVESEQPRDQQYVGLPVDEEDEAA